MTDVLDAAEEATTDSSNGHGPLTFDDTERVAKLGNPREGVVETLTARLERRLQPVDEDEVWHGVTVLTRKDLLEALVIPLPPASTQTAAVKTPSFVYVDAICPVCGIATEIAVELTAKLEATNVGRHLKLEAKHKALAHQCGQTRLRDLGPTRPVKGQTPLDFEEESDQDAGDAPDEPAEADVDDEASEPGEVDTQAEADAVHAIAAVPPRESEPDDLDGLPF